MNSARAKSFAVRLRKTEDHSYPILVGNDLFPRLAADLHARPLGHRYVVVSDARVLRLYGAALLRALRQAGLSAEALSFPAGEKYKTRATKEKLEDAMLSRGVGRDGAIIALGGGVVGDVAGFLAATYQRGIPFIQVPTTLLAMLDSSIGGKTGVDTPAGKNLIGAFHQPRRVYADLSLLATLPRRQFRNGLAEAAKHAMIADFALFALLEKQAAHISADQPALLQQIVLRNLAVKARVVEADEREAGLRRILNYGHTLGHALETLCDFRLLHGEAVALGMALEAAVAVALGYLAEQDWQRQDRLLEALGLPVAPRPALRKILSRLPSPDQIIRLTYGDKKARQGRPIYVLPAKIGAMQTQRGDVGLAVDDGVVRRVLHDSLSRR